MQQLKLEVFLSPIHNQALVDVLEPTAQLNEVKELHLTCVKGTPAVDTLLTVLSQYQNDPGNSCYEHPYGTNFVVKTQKLSAHLGTLMLNTPRKEWMNKYCIVTFNLKKYKYTPKGSSKEVRGVTCLLVKIDLKN